MQPIGTLISPNIGPQDALLTAALPDKTHVRIRPVCEQDAAAEGAFIEALSPRSRRNRFLGQMQHPSDELIAQLTHLDNVHDVAFAAVVDEGGKEKFVGVSRYSTDTSAKACECAVTVLDDWQNKGLGTLLMKHLIEVAQSRGIKRMWSLDSAANVEMGHLARDLAFERSQDPDDATQVIHSLWL